MKKLLIISLLAGSIGSVALPAAAGTIIVKTAPPAPRAEAAGAPRRGYVWTPGYWDWRGNRYQWIKGSYAKERRGYAYREPKWEEHNGRWALQRGAWARAAKDRDGDGVRNRDDAHPNNPNRN